MQTVTCFSEIPQGLSHPIAVTVGSYDGIHLGHQAIFKRLTETAATAVVVTFSNHPSEVLAPKTPSSLLYPPEKKLMLIESCGIDLTVLLPFTKDTASHTYDAFLLKLRNFLPFDTLVLGESAVLGKGRTGTPSTIRAFAQKEGFHVEYLPHIEIDDEPVSSSRIRSILSSGDTKNAARLLGHPI